MESGRGVVSRRHDDAKVCRSQSRLTRGRQGGITCQNPWVRAHGSHSTMSEATATSPEPTSGTGTQSSAALSDQRLAPGSDEQVQQQQHDGATDPPPDLSLSDHTPDDTPSPPVHTPPPPVHYPTPQRPAATPEEWRLHIAHLPTASNNTEGLRRDRDNEERQPSHKAPAARPPPPPPRYVVERLGLALTYLPRGMVTTELWGAVAFLSALADEEGGEDPAGSPHRARLTPRITQAPAPRRRGGGQRRRAARRQTPAPYQ